MRAIRIPTTGPIQVIELAQSTSDDARPLLSELYSLIGCESVECLRLAAGLDAWLDETGRFDGQDLNERACHIASAYRINDSLYGVVILLAADEDTGLTLGLTDDQLHEIARHMDEDRLLTDEP
jgi:hypothetical protein